MSANLKVNTPFIWFSPTSISFYLKLLWHSGGFRWKLSVVSDQHGPSRDALVKCYGVVRFVCLCERREAGVGGRVIQYFLFCSWITLKIKTADIKGTLAWRLLQIALEQTVLLASTSWMWRPVLSLPSEKQT